MSERESFYLNRELSWVEFNARVLEEGLDASNPPLERLRFLSIVSSNFDEFFMVRVAALKSMIRSGRLDGGQADISGMTPAEVLAAVSRRVRELTGRQYACLSHELLPALAAAGLEVQRPADWDASTARWLEDWFASQVEPALTPVAVPPEEEGGFPLTGNLRIHAAFLLRHALDPSQERLAVVQVPPNLNRFVRLPSSGDLITRLALLDDLVLYFGARLFPGWTVRERTLFKVTRDADIGVDEDEDENFKAAMEKIVADRQSSPPVRMTISADSEGLEPVLSARLGLAPDDVYPLAGPIDLKSFMALADLPGFDCLRYPQRKPALNFEPEEGNTVFDELRKRDLVVHTPYESYEPVLDFIDSASRDESTLAIKITLYRTSGDSPVVKALTRAARAGKQVSVVVELKARFDEERNLAWADRLERAGAIVAYGAARLKVHAKAALVIRREEDGLVRRYVHLSTGNYNDRTARLYGDLSLLSSSSELAADVASFFNAMTGLSSLGELRHLAMAPFDLKRRLISMIDREAERSSPETPGLIVAKMNALGDREVMDALYRASKAGVRVRLNVRGICQLVPGLSGLSENIQVVSIVGRYLEHARIAYFRNAGMEEVYLSSADWMPRNLDRRIEIMFPVLESRAKERVTGILMSYFRDTAKARLLGPSGRYGRVAPPGAPDGGTPEVAAPFSAQEYLDAEARREEESRSGAELREIKVRRKAP